MSMGVSNGITTIEAEMCIRDRAGEGPKGSAVRRLKWYVSWVQNVVRQFGPYLPWVSEN